MDAIRWAGMVFVILGHALLLLPSRGPVAAVSLAAIVSFNMPLFAFISGYVLKRVHLSRKFMQLVVPYCVWLGLYYWLIPGESDSTSFGNHLVSGMLVPTGEARPWFPYVLFICFAIWAATGGRHRTRLVLAIGMLLVSPGVPLFGIDRVTWLFPYMVVGWLTKRSGLFERGWLPRVIPLALATWLICLLLDQKWGGYWLRAGLSEQGIDGFVAGLPVRLASHGVSFAAAISGIVTIWAIYSIGSSYAYQAKLGQHTLGMFFTQTPIWYLEPLRSTGSAPLVFLATLAGSATASVLLSKTPLSGPLVGQWKRTARS